MLNSGFAGCRISSEKMFLVVLLPDLWLMGSWIACSFNYGFDGVLTFLFVF